jgi:hypothetical protein
LSRDVNLLPKVERGRKVSVIAHVALGFEIRGEQLFSIVFFWAGFFSFSNRFCGTRIQDLEAGIVYRFYSWLKEDFIWLDSGVILI